MTIETSPNNNYLQINKKMTKTLIIAPDKNICLIQQRLSLLGSPVQ